MYRKRRMRTSRRRRAAALIAFGAALVISASIPTMAFAQTNVPVVDNLLKTLGLGDTTTGDSGSGGTATPEAGTPPNYVPPLHGTNPHGQGSAATVDLVPSNSNPYPAEPVDEEVVAGDSRGEQDSSGAYHGTVTPLWLLGTPIGQIETAPGESKDGPLQGLQDVLDQICAGSGSQACLKVLEYHSDTTSNSSTNSFVVASVGLGPQKLNGDHLIQADAVESNGNIADDGNCQTAQGDSSVAHANVGTDAAALTADAANAESSSQACNDGTQSVNQDSEVVNLAGTGIPVPAAGCDDGTPNTSFTALSILLSTVCNADDTNGSQAGAPYGVREALTAFVLNLIPGSSVVKATTAGPESLARAPGGGSANPPGTTPTTPGGNQGGNQGGNNGGGAGGGDEGDEGAGEGGGGAAGEAAAGNGTLAFTGADLLVLGLVGGALILGGLALTTTAGRRHRQTV
jgi:hypothetical protein